ncbi:hypothetical protein CPJ18_02290 [Agrobacterium rosae]|uniref:Uncharacterized protein n=1 Tax=Agrobacterium rosae TaxID=1972867 RepID=A0AAE5VRZ8_9HYPH|nr:hypothetical protein [Agrobacterium rosae]POO54346.1 hypothetical protein CPJ18_02290 [Agrobacterium rosae]
MYRPRPDEFDVTVAAAGATAQSDERMLRPDHKAKKHGRPKTKYEYMRRFPKKPRNGEEVGGGHFVMRRGDSTGRIRPCMWPFEHPSYDSALTEAARLFHEHGGTYDILSVCGQVAPMPLEAGE